MKIASISVTSNEWHQLDEWEKNYNNYKDSISSHIIVDNNSSIKFKAELKRRFNNSILIFRNKNGGVTAAFNEGIRYAITITKSNLILLICPDILISGESIMLLAKELIKDSNLGVVAPILLKKESDVLIECFGGKISRWYTPIYNYENIELSNKEIPDYLDVDFLPGGINLAKTQVYKTVGLQDESLFMYGDEVDWDLRVKKSGYILRAYRSYTANHNHIFTNNDIYRSDLSYFLINRNTILLAIKYSGYIHGLKTGIVIFNNVFYQILGMIKRKRFKKAFCSFLGIIMGLINNRNIPRFILKP